MGDAKSLRAPAGSANVLRLIPGGAAPRVDAEIVGTLQRMLLAALEGRITGLALVVIDEQDMGRVDAIGTAAESPTWTRGMLRALDDHLAELARDEG